MVDDENSLEAQRKIDEALKIVKALGMPRGQQNERSALTLLALLDLKPGGTWDDLRQPRMGITPIMEYCREHYGRKYAPNTRETFRRQTMHQFVEAGIALHNPDQPDRPIGIAKRDLGLHELVHRLSAERLTSAGHIFAAIVFAAIFHDRGDSHARLAQIIPGSIRFEIEQSEQGERRPLILLPPRHSKRLYDLEGFIDFSLRFQWILIIGHVGKLPLDKRVNLLLGEFGFARLSPDALQCLPIRIAKRSQIRRVHLRVAAELAEIAIDQAAVQIDAESFR